MFAIVTLKSPLDETTLQPAGTTAVVRLSPVLTLAIASHPDPDRVGEVVDIPRGGKVSRVEPHFGHRGAGSRKALNDPNLSRSPFVISIEPDGAALISPQLHGSLLEVDGVRISDSVHIDAQRVNDGVVIELAGRIALLLQRRVVPRVDTSSRALGCPDALTDVLVEAESVCSLDVPILLRGESGVGKELVARALHERSHRAREPFVAINMGAIQASVAASQLFGHVRGAFTGADCASTGVFCGAGGGTLFLDEIGETPIEIQAMLLRVLEERTVRPVGGDTTVPVRCQVIAATDADLEGAVSRQLFRGPLLHRLAGYEIRIPPLRKRRAEMGRLVVDFLQQEFERAGCANRLHSPGPSTPLWLPSRVMRALIMHEWPGNVRELHNVLRRMVVHFRDAASTDIDFRGQESARCQETRRQGDGGRRPRPHALTAMQLIATLETNEWKIAATASALGISRTTLYALMEKFDVRAAKDLSRDDITGVAATTDLEELSRRLRVSPRGLRRRMKELGLPSAGA